MFREIREHRPFLPPRLVAYPLRHAPAVILTCLALTACVFMYLKHNMKINTDLTDMLSPDLPFRKLWSEYRSAFPQFNDTLVVVIEADTPEAAAQARRQLAEALRSRRGLYKTVQTPGGESFFEYNGLLYRSEEKLEDLADSLAEAQAFLALLLRDMSLKGLCTVLTDVLERSDDALYENEKIITLFAGLQQVLDRSRQGLPAGFSWQEMLSGDEEQEPYRRFIVVQPHLDYQRLFPARKAIAGLYGLAEKLPLAPGAEVHITGSVALRNDDIKSVQQGMDTAALISLVLVTITLYLGLRSFRLMAASLITLAVGLVWTFGFAIFAIGSLNLISISFSVLFIGLGIDYSIQLCLRYKEMLESGLETREAIVQAVRRVGNVLILCTITTAIGFYAFVPTAYSGASDLGLIAGTGMFINLLTNMILLPALLSILPLQRLHPHRAVFAKKLTLLPYRYAASIAIITAAAAVASVMVFPGIYFDFNPLNLSNPSADSVKTAKRLFQSPRTAPWSISVLVESLSEATEIANKLKKVPEVDSAVTIADFVPDGQQTKQELIDNIALFMPGLPADLSVSSKPLDETIAALETFEKKLRSKLQDLPAEQQRFARAARSLAAGIRTFRTHVTGAADGPETLLSVEQRLLSGLAEMMTSLGKALQPQSVSRDDLPADLVDRYVTKDGRYRVQVFARDNITDLDAIERFVDAVRSVTPRATDSPVTVLEAGKAVSSAFTWATVYAVVAIVLFLLLVLRNGSEVLLILLPLLLAVLMTGAGAVVCGIPLNFANIIVLPLLLGSGVDYAIHMIYRFRADHTAQERVLQTSTARAVLFSALTTIMSFSTLSFSSHRGTASMGQLLTLCIGFIIFCTLIVLPAVLKLYTRIDHDFE